MKDDKVHIMHYLVINSGGHVKLHINIVNHFNCSSSPQHTHTHTQTTTHLIDMDIRIGTVPHNKASSQLASPKLDL